MPETALATTLRDCLTKGRVLLGETRALIAQEFQKDFSYQRKADQSWVTEIDLAVERLMREKLLDRLGHAVERAREVSDLIARLRLDAHREISSRDRLRRAGESIDIANDRAHEHEGDDEPGDLLGVGVAIAIDRQERGLGTLSAVQEVEQDNGIPVCAIANLAGLIQYLQNQSDMAQNLEEIKKYRITYGIT